MWISLRSRLGIIAAWLVVVGLSGAAALLMPAAVAAQCEYGTCNITEGGCGNEPYGYCERREFVLQYYDNDCDSGNTYCEKDICDFFPKLADLTCPNGSGAATCDTPTEFFCNHQGGSCEFNCAAN